MLVTVEHKKYGFSSLCFLSCFVSSYNFEKLVNLKELILIVPLSSIDQRTSTCSITSFGNSNIYLTDTNKKKGGIKIMAKLYLAWISLLFLRSD